MAYSCIFPVIEITLQNWKTTMPRQYLLLETLNVMPDLNHWLWIHQMKLEVSCLQYFIPYGVTVCLLYDTDYRIFSLYPRLTEIWLVNRVIPVYPSIFHFDRSTLSQYYIMNKLTNYVMTEISRYQTNIATNVLMICSHSLSLYYIYIYIYI